MPRNVLVIGAQGVLGSFIARAFDEAGWHVMRGGRRSESTSTFRFVDLDQPSTVSDACRWADIVVNTAFHPDLVAERTVLDEGGTLIDLVELPGPERRRLRTQPSPPKGLVVTDTGVGGVAYLVLADLLDQHAETDGLRYALMLSASGSSGRAGAVFAHSLLTASARRPTETIPFPEPFGSRRCFEVAGEDTSPLPTTLEDTQIRHYVCMDPRPLQASLLAMNALRLMSLLPRVSFTAGKKRIPKQASEEPICEWAGVMRGDELVASRTIRGKGSYRMTAAATLVFAEALAVRPDDERPGGLRGITEVLLLAEVLPSLAAHGITVFDDGGPLPELENVKGPPPVHELQGNALE